MRGNIPLRMRKHSSSLRYVLLYVHVGGINTIEIKFTSRTKFNVPFNHYYNGNVSFSFNEIVFYPNEES